MVYLSSGSSYRQHDEIGVVVQSDKDTQFGDIVMEPSNPAMEEYVVSVPYIEGGIAGLASITRHQQCCRNPRGRNKRLKW